MVDGKIDKHKKIMFSVIDDFNTLIRIVYALMDRDIVAVQYILDGAFVGLDLYEPRLAVDVEIGFHNIHFTCFFFFFFFYI